MELFVISEVSVTNDRYINVEYDMSVLDMFEMCNADEDIHIFKKENGDILDIDEKICDTGLNFGEIVTLSYKIIYCDDIMIPSPDLTLDSLILNNEFTNNHEAFVLQHKSYPFSTIDCDLYKIYDKLCQGEYCMSSDVLQYFEERILPREPEDEHTLISGRWLIS